LRLAHYRILHRVVALIFIRVLSVAKKFSVTFLVEFRISISAQTLYAFQTKTFASSLRPRALPLKIIADGLARQNF
jgi:hypothetical protein